MKKFYSLITLLVLVLVLAACGGGTVKNASEVNKYLNNTLEEFENAQSVSVVIVMEDSEETITTELAYNKKGDGTVEYLVKMTDNVGSVTTIIKDNKAYMNRYDTKTVVDVSAAEQAALIEEYSFDALTKPILDVFSNSFFNASTVLSSSNSKATLECDTFALVVDSSLSDEEQLEQEELFFSLQMLSSLKLEVEYADSKITKLVGLFENVDGEVSKTTIEFKSVESQNIVVENASEYQAQ